MLKTVVILPDGSTLSSGGTGPSIQSLTLTQSVNTGQELTLGSVCSAMVELTVLCPKSLALQAGDTLTIYRYAGDTAHKIGIFRTEEPVRLSQNRLKIIAYDRVSLLDRDLTAWLDSLDGWPYTLLEFSQMVCAQCGVSLKNTALPNGDFQIRKFRSGQATGRQLLSWAGELSGRFCRADRDGMLEFAWYAPGDTVIGPGGDHPCFAGSAQYQQYAVEPIDKIQLRQSAEDVGTVYPDIPEEVNTYCITGNPLATAESAGSLIGIAQTLYEQLHAVTYTPCKVSIPADCEIAPGDILTVEDTEGNRLSMYVMKRTQKGDRDTLEATGSIRRDSTGAVNHQTLRDLQGKVLNLKTTVDGIQAENRDQAGRLASLSLDVSTIGSEVSRQETDGQTVKTQLTTLTQKAEAVELRVQKLTEDGASKVQTQTGFTFDDQGLTISRGNQMENLLDDSGMYVKRHGAVILQANQDGVRAVDVTVQNYLMVGEHARFEDYSSGSDMSRTACYWI